MDSVRVNDWVANEILGFANPLHVKYEMFLDKGGKNQQICRQRAYSTDVVEIWDTRVHSTVTVQTYHGSRHIGLNDIPVLMDEYDLYEDVYFGKANEDNLAKLTKIKGVYEFINHLKPAKQGYCTCTV